MSDQPITVRPLLKKDQKRISALFLGLFDKIDDHSVQDIMKSAAGLADADGANADGVSKEERTTRIIRAFMKVFQGLLVHFGDEVKTLFADFIGVTVEKYEEMPFDIDIQVLEQLQQRPEISNFFGGALRMFNATEALKSTFANLKTRFASSINSVGKN